MADSIYVGTVKWLGNTYKVTLISEGADDEDVCYNFENVKPWENPYDIKNWNDGAVIYFSNPNYYYQVQNYDGNRISLHRLVFAAYTGINIGLYGEEVHHINGNRHDNRIENLVLLTRADHNYVHKGKDEKRKMEIINTAKFIRDRKIAKHQKEMQEIEI